MEKINTKTLKASLSLDDYEKLLKALDLPIHSKGKYWSIYTGCHHKNALDGSPKLLFYPDTGIFQCLTQCGCSRDIIGLVQARLNVLGQQTSFIDSVNFILETLGIEKNRVQRINKPNVSDWSGPLSQFIRFKKTGTSFNYYDKSILDQLDKCTPLKWIEEGISQQTLDKFQIRYYNRENATTIPVLDKEGNLLGIRCRFWDEEQIQQGKYRPLSLLNGMTYKFPTSQVLYGLNWNWPEIERTKTVTICEGEKGVLKLDSWFGNNSTAVAMFGNNLGEYRRNELLKLGVNQVNMVVDNDWIGKSIQEKEKWMDQIMSKCKIWQGLANVDIIWDNRGMLTPKDNATDYDLETWNILFKNRDKGVLNN